MADLAKIPENTRFGTKNSKIDNFLSTISKHRVKKSAKIPENLPKIDKNRCFFDRFTGRRDHENGKSTPGPPGV